MTVSYDVTTPVGQVRLLSTDSNTSAPVFQDEEITAMLNLCGSDVRLAAAQALDVMAANEAVVMKKVQTLDLNVDGTVVQASLHAQAAELRRQVNEEFGGFDYAEMVVDSFSERDRLLKMVQRESY